MTIGELIRKENVTPRGTPDEEEEVEGAPQVGLRREPQPGDDDQVGEFLEQGEHR
ncbi:MAG: hypothetical protein P8Z70_04405 [Desulfuromonadales bacterium]